MGQEGSTPQAPGHHEVTKPQEESTPSGIRQENQPGTLQGAIQGVNKDAHAFCFQAQYGAVRCILFLSAA
eukprot:968921-Pelagomonas_calceolata.AAC.1